MSGVTTACLKASGKMPCDRLALTMLVMGCASMSKYFLTRKVCKYWKFSKYSLTRKVGQGSSEQCSDHGDVHITFDTSSALIKEKELNGCDFIIHEGHAMSQLLGAQMYSCLQ